MIAGCRECAHNASETFVMDEALGCARVRVQFGDPEKKIEVEFCHGIRLDLVNECLPIHINIWREKCHTGRLTRAAFLQMKWQVSVDSCPVNCIHWVESEELPLLEFLIRPQPKEAHGIFGGGWERPADVFAAAKYLQKQLKQQQKQQQCPTGIN